MIKHRLISLRRSWCIRQNHPMAEWSPVVVDWGETEDDEVVTTVYYRCAAHDQEPPEG